MMPIELMYLFALAALISFVGSLQPGPVNLSVIHASYSQNFRTGLLVAIGGALPELIYSAAALWLSCLFIAHPLLSTVLHWSNAIVLTVVGLLILVGKTERREKKQQKVANSLFSGFLMGFFNPMLFTFWLLISNSLQNEHFIYLNGTIQRVFFIAGTFAGALLLLVLLAFAAAKKRAILLDRYSNFLNKLIGIILLLLAVHELYKL